MDRDARRCQQFIAADVVDRSEVVLYRDLAGRDQLHTMLLAAWGVHEQVEEVVGPVAALHRIAPVNDEILVL